MLIIMHDRDFQNFLFLGCFFDFRNILGFWISSKLIRTKKVGSRDLMIWNKLFGTFSLIPQYQYIIPANFLKEYPFAFHDWLGSFGPISPRPKTAWCRW